MAWPLRRLGDLSEVASGGTPLVSDKTLWGGNIAWYSSGELNENCTRPPQRTISDLGQINSNAKLFPKGSLLIGMYDTAALKMSILDRDAAFNQAIAGVKPRDDIDLRFVMEAINAIKPVLLDERRGVRQKNLSLSKIKDIEIPMPPLSEQKRIVAILDEAFEGIDKAIANTDANLANARELFGQAVASAYADAISRASGVTLSELAVHITDGDHQPPPKALDGVPFITISNINKNRREIDFRDTFKVPQCYFDGLKEYKRPKAGDILYTVTGSYGIPVLVPSDTDFCFQRHIGLIRPRPDINSSWLAYMLLAPQVLEQAHAGATGTAQKTVSLKILRGFTVPNVDGPEQVRVWAKLDLISQSCRSLEHNCLRKLKSLAELKSSLLALAFSGHFTGSSSIAEAAE
jgi:type I restriction enzyme S subunit